MVWSSHLFKNFPQFVVIHTVKGFSVDNEIEDVFWNCLALSIIQQMLVGNLISSSSGFSKPNLNIWKFSVRVPLKPHLKDFEHYLASM